MLVSRNPHPLTSLNQPTDFPRPRGLGERSGVAAVLQQRVHGQRRQNRVLMGRSLRPLRANLLRAPQRRLHHCADGICVRVVFFSRHSFL